MPVFVEAGSTVSEAGEVEDEAGEVEEVERPKPKASILEQVFLVHEALMNKPKCTMYELPRMTAGGWLTL